MKKNSIKCMVAFLVLISSAVVCSAHGSAGSALEIKSVTVKENGNIYLILTGNHLNTEGCAKADQVMFLNAHPGKKEIMSVILTALTLGRTVGIYLNNGCLDAYSSTYPIGATITLSR